MSFETFKNIIYTTSTASMEYCFGSNYPDMEFNELQTV